MDRDLEHEERLCFTALAGTFPGAESADALWQRVLRAEVAPLAEMPPRWGIGRDAIFSPEPGLKNRTYLDRAHCLPMEIERGVAASSGRQFALTRAVLQQVVQEAHSQGGHGGGAPGLEDAALVLGTSWSDESYFLADAQGMYDRHGGARRNATQDRFEWFDPGGQVQALARAVGIGGPALAIDTACSSFAYALDTARALIRTGQARRAVVAGVNTFLPPALFLGFSQLRALSGSARLQAFGAASDGIVPGECVAAFLVEPLHEALRVGRRPLAILRGLGISSDGAEGSVFAPGKQGQLAAYSRAYQGIDPASVHYIEAHGTGTPVGDATELDSLDTFFRPCIEPGKRLPLGSVKAIIGHTLAAAGAASLAKVLLMIRSRTLPPHVAFAPHARLRESCLALDHVANTLSARERAMRVGVSSFGFGGANAHMVIEEALPPAMRTVHPMRAITPGITHLNLAVIDLDAAFGTCTSGHAWQRALAAGDASPGRFPVGRFAGGTETGLPRLDGVFLSDATTIDIAGYRAGPRPLSCIDPFKLLAAHRTKTLLQRHPALMASPDTAIVLCTNMGGARFFDTYRKVADFYATRSEVPPDIVVDDVATMLPTMASGYPAQILDLRSFHQTISGGPGTFWSSLFAAPEWLRTRCRNLLLGAGRYFGCAADVAAAAAAGGVHGEGIGLLALKSLSTAHEDGDRVLATIRSVVDTSRARTLCEARAAAGACSDDEHVEICELHSDATVAPERAQAMSGFLAEAAGIETCIAAILSKGRRGAIEVRRNGTPLFWVFIEKDGDVVIPEDPPVKLAFELSFSPARSARPVQVAHARQPALASPLPARNGTPVGPGSSTTLRLNASEPGYAFPAATDAQTLTLDAYAQLTQSSLTSLQVRSRAIELLCAARGTGGAAISRPSLDDLLCRLRTNMRNIVLADPRRTDDALLATMRIDETHPYFFDHPLDHVPGILLIEGVLQSVDLAVKLEQLDETFVSSIDVRFRRYTEKQHPIAIKVQRAAGNAQFHGSISQSGNVVCECTIGVETGSISTTRRRPAVTHSHPAQARPDKRLLHKSRDENVLVEALHDHAGGVSTRTIAIPEGHFFLDGPPTAHSMLYFLEIARQCLMLVAHTRLDVPLGMPMNLVELRFALDAPIPRDVPLTLVPEFDARRWSGLLHTGRVTIGLFSPDGRLGTAKIVSQVIDETLYALQRNAAAS